MAFKYFKNLIIDWLSKEEEPDGPPICDYDRICYEIRPCDVILIEGRSKISEIIKVITQSAWSHSALYIGKLHDITDSKQKAIIKHFYDGPDDVPLIVEGMLGQGFIVCDMSTYKKDHIRICRPKGLQPNDANKIINYAISRLGAEYDVRHIIDLFRYLVPWGILPRHFRSKLFQRTVHSRVICSTVIAEAFNTVDFPILPLVKEHKHTGLEFIPRNPKLFTPRDFDYSPFFDIIKYPIVDLEMSPHYKNLPWNKEGLVSNDGKIQQTIFNDDDSEIPPHSD